MCDQIQSNENYEFGHTDVRLKPDVDVQQTGSSLISLKKSPPRKTLTFFTKTKYKNYENMELNFLPRINFRQFKDRRLIDAKFF
jgi:hypothetical protein